MKNDMELLGLQPEWAYSGMRGGTSYGTNTLHNIAQDFSKCKCTTHLLSVPNPVRQVFDVNTQTPNFCKDIISFANS